MIACFFGANVVLDRAIIFSVTVSPLGILLAFAVTFLFFLHLRLLNELKDFEMDSEANPDRPLPRGLIPAKEFQIVLIGIIGLEVVLAGIMGAHILTALLIPLVYSFFMFKDFFIGRWLKPKMEAYAISHAFVAALLALFIASAVTDSALAFLPRSIWVVMFMNWMISNTFEFARKTLAREEEREGVETYSRRWGEWGASFWVMMFTFLTMIGFLRLNDLLGWSILFVVCLGLVSAAPWVAAVLYSNKKTARSAMIYRQTCSLYLVMFNLLLLAFGLFH